MRKFNRERAAAGRVALAAFVNHVEPDSEGDLGRARGETTQEYLIDLLTNLRHFVHRYGKRYELEIDDAWRIANGHFCSEVGDEEEEDRRVARLKVGAA